MTPITATQTTAITTASQAPAGTTKSSTDPMLDKNAFLKLMMTQLKNQDPLNPSDPTQYLNELAQMTSLEQQTNIATSTAHSSAIALIGHTVAYDNGSGQLQAGTVQSVNVSGTDPTLTISGVSGILPSNVRQVS